MAGHLVVKLAGILFFSSAAATPSPRCDAPSLCADRRPPPAERAFTSAAVNAAIERLAANMTDSELAYLFRNAYPNTLDTTVRPGASDDTSFIITGDIDAMWLRDSTNQVLPYVPFAGQDAKLASMLAGVLRQQTLVR